MPERQYGGDCLRHGDLWADHTEKANAITRDSETDTLCLTIGVQERGQWLAYYSLRETSRAVAESRLVKRIEAMVADGDCVPVVPSVPKRAE